MTRGPLGQAARRYDIKGAEGDFETDLGLKELLRQNPSYEPSAYTNIYHICTRVCEVLRSRERFYFDLCVRVTPTCIHAHEN